MINIGIIEKDNDRLQELKDFINAQHEFVCTYAAATEKEYLALPADTHLALVILLGSCHETEQKTAGNQIRTIRQKMPDSAIIVFSDTDQTNDILDALRAGAVGFSPRFTPLSQIKEVIVQVLAGGAYLTPAITRKVTDYFRLEEQPDLYALTNREKQIVICLTEGFSYKLIAYNLGLSLDTVRFHLRNIYKKLQVNSKAEAIAKVMKREVQLSL